MLFKCCTQYASEFRKVSSGHRTGKGQFSFQSQRKAMPENFQTTAQLCSFHMLAKWCSKSFKQSFNSMWTKNFQMFNLDLEKADEPEIRSNCQQPLDHRKSRRIPEKHLLCFIDFAKASDSVQFSSVTQWCLTLCNPMDCSMPGFLVHHQLPEFTQTHVHWVSDSIQLSHPLLSPSPPNFNLSQHLGLFRWVYSSHLMAKILEFQLQH